MFCSFASQPPPIQAFRRAIHQRRSRRKWRLHVPRWPTFVATEGWDWIPAIRDRDTGIGSPWF